MRYCYPWMHFRRSWEYLTDYSLEFTGRFLGVLKMRLYPRGDTRASSRFDSCRQLPLGQRESKRPRQSLQGAGIQIGMQFTTLQIGTITSVQNISGGHCSNAYFRNISTARLAFETIVCSGHECAPPGSRLWLPGSRSRPASDPAHATIKNDQADRISAAADRPSSRTLN
jgi:hypothetical protein